MVLGIKNVFELEGVINSRDCCFKFLNRSVPIFPEKEVVLKPTEQKLMNEDSICRWNLWHGYNQNSWWRFLQHLVDKVEFTHNKAILDVVNKGKGSMIFMPEEMIWIIDLRSLGYYKIKQGILQQNLSRYYRFEKAQKLCENFNKFVNTLKKEENRNHQINIHC